MLSGELTEQAHPGGNPQPLYSPMTTGDARHLTEKLAELHVKLAATPNVNDDVRTLLEAVSADIQAILEQQPEESAKAESASQENAGGASEESILERLQSVEEHFAEEHPTLAGLVGSVIDALARMGI